MPPVAAEETYLEQVLRNLLGNAAKYGGSGPIRVTATDLGPVIRMSISDEGPGFPEAEKDRLFELFYRSPSLARTASGAGIGLFVCRQLITAMNGRMWAGNRPGRGSEFTFELPIFQTTTDLPVVVQNGLAIISHRSTSSPLIPRPATSAG